MMKGEIDLDKYKYDRFEEHKNYPGLIDERHLIHLLERDWKDNFWELTKKYPEEIYNLINGKR